MDKIVLFLSYRQPELVVYKDLIVKINNTGAELLKGKEKVAEIQHSPPWQRCGVSAAQVASYYDGNFLKLSLQEQIIFALLASISENYIKHAEGIQKGILLSNFKKAMSLPPGIKKEHKKLLKYANEKKFFGEKDSPKQILKFAKIGLAAILNPESHQFEEAIKIFKKIKSLKIL